MSKALNGIAQINYSEYHKYFTSTGTSLLILSYLGVFGYLTATFSFAGESNLYHVLFLISPSVIGIVMGIYGLLVWKDEHDRKDEFREEELREKRATRSMAESQAKLLEDRAEKAMSDNLSIGGSDIHMEDWL
ncbi:hypothetical protein Hrd1104_10620 [Halorhabdus sp. CBA1104]|uniref:hypothetical protein n=1 Tax=Halorhabdus sp. CBA1104 TaxID=1380432 RepID=UPI0012B1F66F|nr:hypothetical protein [Halorhabdus sp. CBA1104]QGN07707.1 hypothetical protein Hrd1104_10620 [Halorhabdus sp. CBA1104]